MSNNTPEIDEWLAENYDAIVADKNRGITYSSLADDAEAKGSPDLAAWARKRAAGSGKDVKPVEASSEPEPKSKRDK